VEIYVIEKLLDSDDDNVAIYPVPVNDIMTICLSETEVYPAILEILKSIPAAISCDRRNAFSLSDILRIYCASRRMKQANGLQKTRRLYLIEI